MVDSHANFDSKYDYVCLGQILKWSRIEELIYGADNGTALGNL